MGRDLNSLRKESVTYGEAERIVKSYDVSRTCFAADFMRQWHDVTRISEGTMHSLCRLAILESVSQGLCGWRYFAYQLDKRTGVCQRLTIVDKYSCEKIFSGNNLAMQFLQALAEAAGCGEKLQNFWPLVELVAKDELLVSQLEAEGNLWWTYVSQILQLKQLGQDTVEIDYCYPEAVKVKHAEGQFTVVLAPESLPEFQEVYTRLRNDLLWDALCKTIAKTLVSRTDCAKYSDADETISYRIPGTSFIKTYKPDYAGLSQFCGDVCGRIALDNGVVGCMFALASALRAIGVKLSLTIDYKRDVFVIESPDGSWKQLEHVYGNTAKGLQWFIMDLLEI